jgi:hypothetical protein
MEFNAGPCEDCGQPSKHRIETMTGRLVCQSCAGDRLVAGSTAVIQGGGAGEAVALRGWVQRIRNWRLRGRE